jgi:hypothetical protein
MGDRGLGVLGDNRGAVARLLDLIAPMMSESGN